MNRIDQKFQELKRKKRAAFIAYLTVGYPSVSDTEKLILALSGCGVDMFELGIPFSDPLADGPIIQEASAHALKHKTRLRHVFALAKRLRNKIDNPLLLMGYYNPILKYGTKSFAQQAKRSGLDAIIVPDLPIEESGELRASLYRENMYLIDFIAPTTDTARMKKVAKQAKGFIYYVSTTGVTGARKALAGDIASHVRLLKRITSVPVCVGFGISQKKHFKALTQYCDGAIIGSAIIRKIQECGQRKQLVSVVSSFVRNLTPYHV